MLCVSKNTQLLKRTLWLNFIHGGSGKTYCFRPCENVNTVILCLRINGTSNCRNYIAGEYYRCSKVNSDLQVLHLRIFEPILLKMSTLRFDQPENFSFEPKDWPLWKENFERYHIASGLSKLPDEEQINALISHHAIVVTTIVTTVVMENRMPTRAIFILISNTRCRAPFLRKNCPSRTTMTATMRILACLLLLL